MSADAGGVYRCGGEDGSWLEAPYRAGAEPPKRFRGSLGPTEEEIYVRGMDIRKCLGMESSYPERPMMVLDLGRWIYAQACRWFLGLVPG